MHGTTMKRLSPLLYTHSYAKISLKFSVFWITRSRHDRNARKRNIFYQEEKKNT